VIWKFRLPRLLAAAVLGGALSVSGFLLQNFFRNPIAGPYVLGISSGAKMLVGAVMILGLKYFSAVPFWAMMAAAFLGSMLVTGFVLLFARRVRSMAVLLVVGIMIGSICTAATDVLITFADEAKVASLHSWSMGSFSAISWTNLHIASAVIFLSVAGAIFLSKPMSAYQLGEDYARSMGVNIKAFRVALIGLSSLLSASVTALSGPISFVGVAVPHMAKLLFGTARPIVIIPGSFLLGGVFCMACDLIARTAFSPSELAISTVTAVFGAPVVILLMLRRQRRKTDA
jgi:iron complex transport system permease protein